MEKIADENHSILIVDDVPKNIQLVAKILTKEGLHLHFSQGGENALKQLKEHKFDLILLDIMMPGMDGFEVCRQIKRDPVHQSTPVIFLTAKTDDDSIAKGFDVGGVDYVTKPFNPQELVARVKTHLELRRRENELVELSKTKDTLLSIISHDLKTPFFNIMGLGELLLSNYEEYDDQMKTELISNMVDAARSSHSLLDNLLSWMRAQTGTISYNPVTLNIYNVVECIIELMSTQCKNKGITIVPAIDKTHEVYADINMFNTILRNLISNAIKYTPKGGKISIGSKTTEHYAIIEISDTGVGIPAEKLEMLFTDSRPETSPGTDQEPGSGYGLMITKDFVTMNKGSISAQSTENKGSTFKVQLPLPGV